MKFVELGRPQKAALALLATIGASAIAPTISDAEVSHCDVPATIRTLENYVRSDAVLVGQR